MDRMFLHDAIKLRWSLARGDVVPTLKALGRMSADDLDSIVARMLCTLAKLGYIMSQQSDCVRFVAEISWSTVVVEQGHGSSAAAIRLHPESACQP